MQTTTITSKGQVTIPVFIREQYGFNTGDKVLFNVDENKKVTLEAAPDFFQFRGVASSELAFNIKKMRQAAITDLVKRYD